MIARVAQQVTGLQESTKVAGDFAAGSLVIASIASWIPWLLALPGAVYACLRIYEWFESRRKNK